MIYSQMKVHPFLIKLLFLEVPHSSEDGRRGHFPPPQAFQTSLFSDL